MRSTIDALFTCGACRYQLRLRLEVDVVDGVWRPAEDTPSGDELRRLARMHRRPRACRLTVSTVPGP